MLTSFFSKHKPVIFLLVAIYMALFFLIHYTLALKWTWNLAEIGMQIVLLGIFLISMIVVDFVSKKNDLSRNNTYKIFLFAIFVTMLPQTFLNEEVLLSNFFVLLAMRRIFSLHSQKETPKKIFDAALWISLATCFYFWSFFFFIPLFTGIFLYVRYDFRNWLIPFIGSATIIILVNVYTLLTQDAFYTPLDWAKSMGFDFSLYNTASLLIPVTFILAVIIWVLGYYIYRFKKRSAKNKQTDILLISTLIASTALILTTAFKNGSEFLFLAMPFAILVTNYIESPYERIFKEILLWVLLVIPFIMLFL